MTLILDAGALLALERNDRVMWRRLKATKLAGTPPRTHGGVIAQVWRGGAGPQAPLARAVKSIETTATGPGETPSPRADRLVGRRRRHRRGRTGSIGGG